MGHHRWTSLNPEIRINPELYYIPIMIQRFNSVFWPSDTEKRINELRFSDSVSLSFKTYHYPLKRG